MTRRASMPILVLIAIALAIACDNAAGPPTGAATTTTTTTTTTPEVVATAKLGAQSGTVAVGIVGSAAFAATTTNVADGTAGTISWFASAEGTTAASAPTGITATVSAVSGNAATVTMTSDKTAIQGSYYFALTEGEAVSAAATLRVADWEFVGSEGFTSGDSTYLSLKLDSKNRPYLGYSDGGASHGATVMKYSEGSWSTVGSSNFSSGSVQHVCMDLDSADRPVLAANFGSGVAWKYDSAASSWMNLGAYSSDMGLHNSMQLDSSGNIYIAFMETDYSNKARVVCNTGSGWTDIGSSTGISSGPATYVSLALDTQGIPYIAYVDGAYGNGITVLKYDGSSSWSALGAAGGVSAAGQDFVSFAMGPGDTPYVAYLDTTNSYIATVKKYDSSTSSWISVGSSTYGSHSTYYDRPSLAISSAGSIYLAITDGLIARATVIKYDAASDAWTSVGRTKISPAEVEFMSLDLDSSGMPYLAYCNVDDYKASVLRFR